MKVEKNEKGFGTQEEGNLDESGFRQDSFSRSQKGTLEKKSLRMSWRKRLFNEPFKLALKDMSERTFAPTKLT